MPRVNNRLAAMACQARSEGIDRGPPRPGRSRPRLPALPLLAALFLAHAAAAPALAADPARRGPRPDPAFNTTRMMTHDGNECREVPGCRSVHSEWLTLADNQARVLSVGCPEGQPNAWHWDTEQHEHIYVRLVARTRTGLTLHASNQQTGASGAVRIHVGCSSKRFDATGTGYMVSRRGIPSMNWGSAKEVTP